MNKSGVALLTVVLFTFLLSIMGISFLAMINTDLREIESEYQELQSLYVAEAGIEKLKWYKREGYPIPSVEEVENLTSLNPSHIIGSYTMSVHDNNLYSTGFVGSSKVQVTIVNGIWNAKFGGK